MRVTAAAAVLAITCGCSSAQDAGKGNSGEAPAKVASPGRGADNGSLTSPTQRLPITAYAYSVQDFHTVMAARKVVVAQCLRKFGLTIPSSLDFYWEASGKAEDRRYGVTDLEVVKSFGYHVPPARTVDPNSLDGDLRSALVGGTGGEVNGVRTSATGCMGESKTRLPTGQVSAGAEAASRIDHDSFAHSLDDPAVKKSFQDWSGCMKRKGFAYATPLQALGDKRFSAATAAGRTEIATAVADVGCKDATGTVRTWLRTESAEQQAGIAADRESLQSLLAAHAAVLTRANQLLHPATALSR